MAKHNPFQVFRKNQRAWLAGLTIFTMFSFIALGSMMTCLQTSGPQRQTTDSLCAKTTTLGPLDYWTYQNHRDGLQRLMAFLESATTRLVQEREIIPYGPMLLVLHQDPVSGQQVPVLLDTLTSLMQEIGWTLGDGERVGERWLVVETGLKKRLGADEGDVRSYLSLLFQDKLTPEDLAVALRQGGLSEGQLVALLENQIVYDRMVRLADGGRRADSLERTVLPTGHANLLTVPSDALAATEWMYRNVKVDVAAFPVELYFDQIPNPSDETLKNFYEKYKSLPFVASSKTPGFVLPTKAAFEIVRGELTDERVAAVTEEEIVAFYEANKASFARPTQPAPPTADVAPHAGAMTDADLLAPLSSLSLPADIEPTPVAAPDIAPSEATSGEVTPSEATSGETAPAGEITPAAEQPVPEPVPSDPAADENSQPAGETEEKEKSEEQPTADASAEAQPEPESTAAESRSPFRLVSQEETASDEPAATSEEPENTENPPAESAAAIPTERTAEPVADDGYFSLELVRDDIRRKLAGDKLAADLDVIYAKMTEYADQLANKRANVSSGEVAELPLAELAKEAGFDFYATTGTIEDGGEKGVMVDFQQATQMRLLPDETLQQVFAQTPMEYAPARTELVAGTISLYWTTEVKAEHLPEFADVRDLVLATWKKGEAAQYAEADAAQLAERVESSGKMLAELAADEGDEKNYLFAATETFTGFLFPRGFRNPNLTFGEIREVGVAPAAAERENKVVIAPGKEFYEAAYRLEVNGVEVIRNQPEERIFVIQLTEKDSDETVLEKTAEFAADRFAQQAMANLQAIQNAEFQTRWLDTLKKEAGFEWLRIPSERR